MTRRGACPTFSIPMPTGDGLLARLHPAGPLSLPAFAGLCCAAATYGNGIVEVTQRGSLQIRGLAAETLERFRADVEALDFDAPEGVVVLTPPLSGRSLKIADSVRKALRESGIAGRVAPKTTIIVDAGDGLVLDGLTADIRLRAAGPHLHLGLGQDPVEWIGMADSDTAAILVVRMLEALATAGRADRVRDLLHKKGRAPFLAAVDGLLGIVTDLPPHRSVDAVGRHARLFGQVAVGVGLAFGSATAATLQALLLAAGYAGAERVWAAPGRAIVFDALPSAAVEEFVAETKALGFVVDPEDPCRRVHACAGAPECLSGLQVVRALAREVARIAPALLEGEDSIHLSGCSKGCAHPGKAAITLVGAAEGFRLVLDGRADAAPVAELAVSEILTKLPDLLERRRRVPESAVGMRGVGAGRG